MARYHLINGKRVAFTAEEEAARDKQEAESIAELAAKQYKIDRTREGSTTYPTIGEQLDLLWHAIDADTDLKAKFSGFYNSIKEVKDANPKPS